MGDFIRLVGPERSVEIFNVRLIGLNAQTATKLVFTLVFILFAWALGWLLNELPVARFADDTKNGRDSGASRRSNLGCAAVRAGDDLDLVRQSNAVDDGARPIHRRFGDRLAKGHHRLCRLFRLAAGQNVQHRRSLS